MKELDAWGIITVFVVTACVEVSLRLWQSRGTGLTDGEVQAHQKMAQLVLEKNKVRGYRRKQPARFFTADILSAPRSWTQSATSLLCRN